MIRLNRSRRELENQKNLKEAITTLGPVAQSKPSNVQSQPASFEQLQALFANFPSSMANLT
jgi:hypothetical protein